MKKIIPLFALLIVTALTISFVRPGKTMHSGTHSDIHYDSWVTFENGSCKMLFPKTPVDESQTVNTAIGELKLNNHSYEVPDGTEDDNLVYLLSETEFSDSNTINSKNGEAAVDKYFRGSVDGAVNSVQGKLLTEEVIQLDGYPGRKFRINVKDGAAVITMRSYLVRNKVYMLQVITETKKDYNKSIDKFMSSFTLKH